MKKLSDWLLAAVFTGIVVPFGLWLLQRYKNRERNNVEKLNLYLEAKLKIDQLTEKKILELEEKEKEMSDLFTRSALKYKDNLDECMRATQASQLENIELQKTLKISQQTNAELQTKLEAVSMRSTENMSRIEELTKKLAAIEPDKPGT